MAFTSYQKGCSPGMMATQSRVVQLAGGSPRSGERKVFCPRGWLLWENSRVSPSWMNSERPPLTRFIGSLFLSGFIWG